MSRFVQACPDGISQRTVEVVEAEAELAVEQEEVDAFVECVRLLGPTFGGINLEDIRAPGCFIIEQRLRELMDIPVFHDDQHGTAIIATAGLINALDVTGRTAKRLGGEDVKVIVRSPFDEMKASPWEKEDAQHEGIPILDCRVPRAFLHPLVRAGEWTGGVLATLHNLRFSLDFMAELRQAISSGPP